MIIEFNEYEGGSLYLCEIDEPETKFILKSPDHTEMTESDLVSVLVALKKVIKRTQAAREQQLNKFYPNPKLYKGETK